MTSNHELNGVQPLLRTERGLATKVAALMSDGIERTADEVAAAADMDRTEALKALEHLCDAGAAVGVDGKYRLPSSDERG